MCGKCVGERGRGLMGEAAKHLAEPDTHLFGKLRKVFGPVLLSCDSVDFRQALLRNKPKTEHSKIWRGWGGE